MRRISWLIVFFACMVLVGTHSVSASKPDLTVSCSGVEVILDVEGPLMEGTQIECPGPTIVNKMVVLNVIAQCPDREVDVRVNVELGEAPSTSSLYVSIPCGSNTWKGERYVSNHEDVCGDTHYFVIVSEGEVGGKTFSRIFEGQTVLTCE